MPLLELRNLDKVYKVGGMLAAAKLTAVDDVSLSMSGEKASILSVVGESGSGKSTLAKVILHLIEPTSGTVVIDDTQTSGHFKNKHSLTAFKRLVQPIFQNPFEAFSTRRKVVSYLYDTALKLGVVQTRGDARDVIAGALASVGLDLAYVAGKYSSQFSGGELQRISIARALICRPKLIVADEPVAMIDASLKMTIVNLFLKLKTDYNVSFIYITHDLSTAYYVSDFVVIMYRGTIVESGPSSAILTAPAHPYTELLMHSIPVVGSKWKASEERFEGASGGAPAADACKFADRCPYVRDICRTSPPPRVRLAEGREALCYRPVDYTAVQLVGASESGSSGAAETPSIG